MTPAEASKRIAGAEWLRRPATQRILELLEGAAGRTRVVGGVVRDTILGREGETNDLDLATELPPDEVMRLTQNNGVQAYPTGVEHGTVTLKLNDQVVEVTTLREDIATDGRRATVRFGTDWTRDAARRDFTLNALYAEMDGTLFDPLGGLADVLAGRVRFIGDADMRIAEDRLRVYRFFRFSASHGGQRLDPDGLAAVTRAAGDLGSISAERVGAEMTRMLSFPKIATTLRAMSVAGVVRLADDALAASESIEMLEPTPTLGQRLALIARLAMPVEGIQTMWRLSNDDVRTLTGIEAAARLLQAGQLHEAAFRYPLFADEAVAVAGVEQGWDAARIQALKSELATIRPMPFPLSGDDLIAMGWSAGRALGDELDRLTNLWIASRFKMTKRELLGTAQAYRG